MHHSIGAARNHRHHRPASLQAPVSFLLNPSRLTLLDMFRPALTPYILPLPRHPSPPLPIDFLVSIEVMTIASTVLELAYLDGLPVAEEVAWWPTGRCPR